MCIPCLDYLILIESVMNTRTTSKQGRKVMGLHKAPPHRPATLFFLSESNPLRWALIRLIANFESVMNTQTIKKCESVLFSIKPLR